MNKKDYYYYCSECRQLCADVERDFGVGSYEYWGADGCDSNVKRVSECCDGDLIAPDEFKDWLEAIES
jgi:hypothetical protein